MRTDKAPDSGGFVFELEKIGDRLTLFARHHPNFGGVCVDWSAADAQRRVRAGKRQLLARAIGLHKRSGMRVLDATGGLGRDAYTLAALGADVTVAEREPLIFELLADGLRRAAGDPAASRLQLVAGDARKQMQDRAWDVIYLDPMYPGHDRDAASKKEMQFLRELTGGSEDAKALLESALAADTGRVVVKRPASAPTLGSSGPAYSLSGTQARFDVYVVRVTAAE